MKKQIVCLTAFAWLSMSVVCAAQTGADKSDVAAQLLGTWKLIAMEAQAAGGEITYPYGRDAVGYITYDAGGRMSVHITRTDRPRVNRQSAPEEKSKAFDGYIAYFGTYEIDERNGVVIHHMEGNLTSSLTGTDYIRYYEFDGDKLILIPTQKTDGKLTPKAPWRLRLTWQHLPDAGARAVADRQVEAEVMKVLDEYMAAWNRQDMAAWERTFHFPHHRLASGKMSVLERPGLQDAAKVWAAIPGWHHSQWERRRIVHASADKVHVDTMFARYRADGSKIGSYESLYILTKEDGRWGVKLRSSFAQ